MDDTECSSDDMLERILQDPNSKPTDMQFEYLKRITDDFSDEQLLGEGGFGKVYKGHLQNGKMIAVKKIKLLENPDVMETQFKNEVFSLMSLRHPNIVRCLGYCFNTSRIIVPHNENLIFAESPKMLLCFEYLTMGSLDKHLKDESSGLDWRTCYKIIEGVCCGLYYLHEECRPQNNNAFIIHLDLKPANILLDENMVPKIADFGLSKFLKDKKTQTFPVEGTLGYVAPEYVTKGKTSTKADIYSLGVVIIEIITGSKADISNLDIEQIINKWRNRSAEALSLVDCQQIRSCLEIGKCCIKTERNERPTMREITNKLSSKSTDCSLHSEEGPLHKKTKISCHTPPENQLCQLRECLSDQPSDTARPPSVQEMACSSTEQQPSRVQIFEGAMEYIKHSSVGVIGIWGLGGVGKTHLLRKINDAFVGDSSFDHVIFVTASKEGSVEKIQGEIGKKLKLWDRNGNDVESRANIILDFLKTRKFLILLDDVWNRIDLEAVGIPPLGSGAQQRRKVVLTTRSKTVCGQMDVRKQINVACLPHDEARQLFQDKVGQETLSSSPRIEALAKELMEELKGLPLALITVGRAMYGKINPKQWESAMDYMKQSCCGGDDQDLRMEEDVFRRLKFSYDNLRNDTLRECLLTCSLWPEDEMILTGDLIRCWIGLGLVDECDIHGSFRKAHSLIGELTAACLLDSCSTDKQFRSVHILKYLWERECHSHQELPIAAGVKMHDVIRGMAIWISCGCGDNKGKWVVHAGVGANVSICAFPWSRAECISLMSNEIEELHPFTGSTNLKRLYLQLNRLDERIFGAIQSFTELTYLDLSSNRIKEIPEELFALVNLEHLDLSDNNELSRVPERLRELTKLKFLYLGGTNIEWIPEEVISCLTELQVIDLVSCGDMNNNDTTSTIIQELCTLTNLKAVDIVIDGEAGYESLRKAAGIPIMDLIISGLEETKELRLAVDTLTGDIAGRTLNELHVVWSAMEQIIVGKPFDALSVLGFQGLDNLTNIIMSEGTSSSFPRLTHLYLDSCGKLEHLSWASYLPCLEYLSVRFCDVMKQLICMGIGQDKSSKTFACLKYLILVENDELASLCGSDVTFPCLEELTIAECSKLKRLPFTMQTLPHKLTIRDIDHWDELEWEDEGVKSFLEQVPVRKP